MIYLYQVVVYSNGSGLKTDGTSQMTGSLNMNSNKITNLITPTIRTDAATKGYVDSSIATIMTNVDMNSNQIFNLGDPVDSHDPVTKEYVDSLLVTGLKTDGTSQMRGNIDMNTNQINNLVNPTVPSDGATKGYTDNLVSEYL